MRSELHVMTGVGAPCRVRGRRREVNMPTLSLKRILPTWFQGWPEQEKEGTRERQPRKSVPCPGKPSHSLEDHSSIHLDVSTLHRQSAEDVMP